MSVQFQQPVRRHGRVRTALTALVVVLALVVGTVGLWSGQRWYSGRPAGTPQAVELAQAEFSTEMTSATVLAVGEATHGTSEFRKVWQQVAEKVVDKGFTTIVLEENTGSVSRVNEWVQGGPGTVEQAVAKFGFRLSRTREMADFLTWARQYNQGKPAAARVQFYGLDMQRPEADRDIALAWLASKDDATAKTLSADLKGVSEDTAYDKGAGGFTAAAEKLQRRIDELAGQQGDDASLRASASARSLVQATVRGAQGVKSYDRDKALAEHLGWLVDQRQKSGAEHSLLFFHNGHLDRAGQASAAGGSKLGQLSVERWGDKYKVIGVDATLVRLRVGDASHEFTVNSPVRGIFSGTTVGYLQLAQASAENRPVLERAMPMASAGSEFSQLYAAVPLLHEVKVTPVVAWDALIHVRESHPVTPLG